MKGRSFSLRNFFSNLTNSEINHINNKNTLIANRHSADDIQSFNNSNNSNNIDMNINSTSSPIDISISPTKSDKSPPLSILKKRIASSGEAVELTLGSYTNVSWNTPFSSPECSPPVSAPCSPSQKRKSAQFKDDVDIMYFSKEDSAENTSKGKREQEKLKEISTKKSKHTSVHHLIKCPLHDKYCNGDMVSHFTDVQGNIIVNEPLIPGKVIEIVEENNVLRYKISVPIGHGFIRNRTNVKAMTGGKKLIITGFKMAKLDSGEEYMHQFNDKLSLPHAIDAFAVKATMSREGTLKISAPIISSSSTTVPTPSLTNAVVT